MCLLKAWTFFGFQACVCAYFSVLKRLEEDDLCWIIPLAHHPHPYPDGPRTESNCMHFLARKKCQVKPATKGLKRFVEFMSNLENYFFSQCTHWSGARDACSHSSRANIRNKKIMLSDRRSTILEYSKVFCTSDPANRNPLFNFQFFFWSFLFTSFDLSIHMCPDPWQWIQICFD